MTADPVGAAYSGLAPLYIDLFGTPAQVHADDLRFVRGHLGPVRGPVLDLGCGPGQFTLFLRSLGVDARGIDLVPEFIAHARAADPGGDYRVGSLSALEFADRSVAGILAWFSLIHRPPSSLDEALAEFRRVLTPDGVLVIGMFDGSSSPSSTFSEAEPFDHKVVTAYRWSRAAFAGRLERAGFEVADVAARPADETSRAVFAMAASARA